MSKKAADAGDDKKRYAESGDLKEDTSDAACNDEDTDEENEDDTEEEDEENQCKSWLQVLPSKGGLLLAALLVEIMTEGMTPDQMNILGNFIASVGTLISYKASRDDIDS